MPTVTISRGIGTRGDEIGHAVAERLGVRCLEKEILHETAAKSNIEVPKFEELYRKPPGLLEKIDIASGAKVYLTLVHRLIRDYADGEGAVLLGRAAHVVLRDRENVFSVRVEAPMALRMARVCADENVRPEVAHDRIAASDRERAYYHQFLYGEEWDSPHLYHAVLNTGMVDVDWAVEQIVWATQHLPRRPTLKEAVD